MKKLTFEEKFYVSEILEKVVKALETKDANQLPLEIKLSILVPKVKIPIIKSSLQKIYTK